MPSLRNAHLIARCVLVWFAVSIGVAIASPLVQPQHMQLVCSASGALKIVASSDAGSTQDKTRTQVTSHTLDCSLCANLGAPPPAAAATDSFTPPLAYALPHYGSVQRVTLAATPPPARGPPASL